MAGTSPAKTKLFGRFPLLFGRKIFPGQPCRKRDEGENQFPCPACGERVSVRGFQGLPRAAIWEGMKPISVNTLSVFSPSDATCGQAVAGVSDIRNGGLSARNVPPAS